MRARVRAALKRLRGYGRDAGPLGEEPRDAACAAGGRPAVRRAFPTMTPHPITAIAAKQNHCTA